MTRSGYLPRVQDKSVHLTSGLDLFRSGQNFFFCDFPQTMLGVFKPHNSLRLFVFLGKMSVLLALLGRPPCPWLRLQAINTAIRAIPVKEGKDVAMNNGMLIQRKVPGQPVVRRPIPTR